MSNDFRELLKVKMDEYAHTAYRVTKKFPKEELYGVTSQLRRAALSIVLNYIEGYARRRPAQCFHFWEISYGSLKEAKYLITFCYDEGYVTENDFERLTVLGEEIGAMLWKALDSLSKHVK